MMVTLLGSLLMQEYSIFICNVKEERVVMELTSVFAITTSFPILAFLSIMQFLYRKIYQKK